MVLRRAAILAAFAAAVAVPTGAALAQAAGAKASKAQVDAAMFRMGVMLSAFQSKEVEAPVKDALAGCLYENSFQKISDTMDKLILANPGKIDQKNPDQVLGIMAGVCGYKPAAARKAVPAPAPVPAKPGKKPGR